MRGEIRKLSVWFFVNNLSLNTSKTKELITDFRRHRSEPALLHINGGRVERVSTFKFMGVQISEDLCRSANTSAVVEKAQQQLHFL